MCVCVCMCGLCGQYLWTFDEKSSPSDSSQPDNAKQCLLTNYSRSHDHFRYYENTFLKDSLKNGVDFGLDVG